MVRRSLVLVVAGLAVLGVGCGSGSSGGSDGGASKASTTTTEASTFAGLDPTDLTFRPVVAVVACSPSAIDDSTTTSTTLAKGQDVLATSDGATCYVVGPPGGDGTDIRDAKVYADGVGIEVQSKPESADKLNELFDACFAGKDTCPAASVDGHGYVAIVADDVVLSAPSINGEQLASSPFVITGKFDKEQANNLAEAINGY